MNPLKKETIIYERVNKQIYARYAEQPNIPRWRVSDIDSPSILGYDDWKTMLELCDTNPTFKKQFDKVVNLYYILKEEGNNG